PPSYVHRTNVCARKSRGRNVSRLSHTIHETTSLDRADPELLTRLVTSAGFRDVTVTRIRQEGTLASFDEYWNSIEAGIGTMPRAYLALDEDDRRLVREEVQHRLSRFQVGGELVIPRRPSSELAGDDSAHLPDG